MDTYEKKYNEALEWMRELYPGLHGAIKEDAEHYFPELRESEDERIRKEIINYLDFAESHNLLRAADYAKKKSWLAYLEKQKERGPLSKDEEYTLARIIEYLEDNDCPSEWKDLLHDVYLLPYQKEQKPILEVFGFEVGDAVRLKDGDGRKHIIKSFEEVEGVHGPNFYHVEFEDNSARDGIYPGEEYPNGYYTQMEKFEEEQKPAEWSEEEEKYRKILLLALNDHPLRTDELAAFNWLKSLRPQPHKEIYQAAKHNLAIKFMNYLDENRPEDKMSLSNGECEDIDKAFEKDDWVTIMKYVAKYQPFWKPSEEQFTPLLKR